MQRKFILGENWIYFKIYSGQKTSDLILTDIIKPLSKELISYNLIEQWFFIRYTDPAHHIRWRLFTGNTDNIGEIIKRITKVMRPHIFSNIIHNIQTDTYNREIERYGSNSINHSESHFFYESIMIVDMLDLIKDNSVEDLRWLYSMKAIDQLLTDYNFDLNGKLKLLKILADSFGNEFNINSYTIKQLSSKYRKNKKIIFDFMSNRYDETSPYNNITKLINIKSQAATITTAKILELCNKEQLSVRIDNLMFSYIHMLNNRIFRSNPRLHELVIYGFLFRYYKSVIAREKYNK